MQSPNVVWTQQETEGPRSTGGCVVNSFSALNDSSWANKSTPLHEAMFDQDIATLLIDNGANINHLNALGRTALHEAAKNSRFDDAGFLIRKGANVNAETQARIAKDSDWGQRIGVANLTPLHEAIGVGDEKMVAILIEGGANVNHVSREGWSPLDLALLDQQEQIIEVLLAHGARFISLEKHMETRPIKNTNCAEQRRLARQLLDCDDLLPSSECREAYLDLLSNVVHSLNMEGVGSTDTRCSSLVSAFRTHLYNMAERRDPHWLVDTLVKDEDDRELGTASQCAFELVNGWLRNCTLNHENCGGANTSETDLPTRLINVGDETHQPYLRISQNSRGQYCALSYCWGNAATLRTENASFADRTRGISLESMPSTIRDAVIITRELGFQYLWVDSICIIQDNDLDWNQEAANMANIYANSALTISASDSNDSSGGCFRKRIHKSTSPVQLSLRLPRYYRARKAGCNSLFALSSHANSPRATGRVDSRAWTLQEQILSPRVLHYSEGAIHWDCRTLSASESDPTGASHIYHQASNTYVEYQKIKRSIAKRSLKFDQTSKEALYIQWQQIVQIYTPRVTTKPTDRVTALLGIVKRFEIFLQDDSVAGIWKGAYCLRSLLWKAKQGDNRPIHNYPSWSWASISAPIEYPYHKCFNDSTSSSWEISSLSFDVDTNQSQNRITGNISMNGTLKLFRRLDIQKCHNLLMNPLMSHLTKQDFENKSMEKILEELLVVWGSIDVVSEDEEIWCLVVARIPWKPPPKFGYPAFRGGRPPSIVCLCLTSIDTKQSLFRRVGLCEMWDQEVFWAGVQKDVRITIV
ncbi:hypothetical protein MMC18_000780 [Xylographa bjoerkii]|nr:hypothetical protein [Xylographa bjoerkii]